MRIHLCALFFLLLLAPGALRAQLIDREAFDFVDNVVMKAGPMKDSSLAGILGHCTAPCHDEVCQLRAIYMWVVSNIEADCTPPARIDHTNGTASYTLQNRRGTSQGVASLVAEMCRMRGIHCEIASGLVKTRARQIGNMSEAEDLGFWNVVRADGRWFVIDAYLGTGVCEGRNFTRETTDAWFLTNRRLFARSHLPAEPRQQLIDSPATRSEFLAGPAMGTISAILGVLPMPGQRGLLRCRADSSITLRFLMWPASMIERISSVGARCDGVLMPAEYESSEDTLIVRLPVVREGSYETELLINDKPAWAFQTQAGPALRRRREGEAAGK